MSSNVCGIYMILNVINNKIYIGQARDIYDRWREHKRSLNANRKESPRLQNAWNKYGEENFEFRIVELCENEKEIMKQREQYWMDEVYHSRNRENGYNIREAGYTGRHDEESREKMSNSHKGKLHSDETKRKMSIASKGKPKSDETKSKMKENHCKDFGENHFAYDKKVNDATSIYFGVSFCRKYENWKSRIMENRKLINLGCYKNEIDAAMTYDLYIIENNINRTLNFPEKLEDYKELINNGN